MAVNLRSFVEADTPAWDAFVESHPHGTVFHLTAWLRAIRATFGYQQRYLLAERGGQISGVLPLFFVSNFIQGRILLSSPFAVYGGVLAGDEESRMALAEGAARLGRELGVGHVELRNGFDAQRVGWAPVDRYVTFTQKLQPQDGEALIAAVPKKTRNLIRKALKSSFSSRPASSLDHFRRLMLASYRRLGTPAFPSRHFENLVRELGPHADMREILLEDKVIAATMNFLFRGEMHTYYAASDPDFWSYSPNNFLYYDHILWASNNGMHTFDFGRSKYDTGTFDFKKHWLTEMRPLPYEMLLINRKQMPDFTPKNPKFQVAIRLWQRMPIGLTKLIGPPLVRLFP
jgi:FemAB-related protein (PEP-CTERM system-associated)